MRTLRQIRELYEPKSPDEKKFVAKHKVEKTPDANKNGDDVFKASNIKGVSRQPEHGYDPGKDEKVYEEVDEGYVSHAQRKAVWANRADGGRGHPDKKKKMKEEVEQVDEIAKAPKNPHHIKTVEGAGRGMITITTNAGAKHTVSAKDTGGKMPSPGEHISKYVKEEIEKVQEVAPPGSKFERMVKHIKKSYSKDGLTPKEKSIAYATAWKQYNKEG